MRRMWSLVPVCVVAIAVAAAAGTHVDRARGTTGATGLPQPKEVVARSIGDRFIGRYALTTVDRRSDIVSGELAIEWTHTARPFLLGFLYLYRNDADGRQSSFISNVYPFSYRKGTLAATVTAQGSGEGLGRLALRLPTDPDDRTGTLRLGSTTAYAVSFRRREETASPTAALPPAERTDGGAPVTPTHAGLGTKNSTFYGRYGLLSGDAQAGQNAGLFGSVVRIAARLSGDGRAPDSGSVTLFGNTVKKGAPLVPAGIVTLHRPDATDVAYLTDFKWGGDRRRALVRGGSTEGPVVGRLTEVVNGDTLDGTLIEGARRTDVRFVRER
jgi:hypothetical protein